MTDHIIQTHTCITCGGYGCFSEPKGKTLVWYCGYQDGKPICLKSKQTHAELRKG